MSSTVEPPVEPIVAACAQVTAGLAALARLRMWTVGEADVLASLDVLMAAQARLVGLQARLIGEVDSRGLAAGMGCANTRAVLRHRYRLHPAAARQLADLAYAAGSVFPTVGQGMVDGAVHPAQAEAMITGLDKLPAGTSTDQRTWAEQFLVEQAARLDPTDLRRAASRIVEKLTVVSADGDAPPDEPAPDPQAARSVTFNWRNGGLAGQFFIPGTDAAKVAAFFTARAQPDSQHHGDPDHPDGYDTRNLAQRQYDALIAALEHAAGCDNDPAPSVAQILITMDYRWLAAHLGGSRPTGNSTPSTGPTAGAGWPMPPGSPAPADRAPAGRPDPEPRLLDLDQPLSPAEARRLACDATIIPAVLGSAGQVLDVGRTQRLFGPGLRRALALRDGGCSFAGCDKPPAGCDGHHLITPWHQFGQTCLANGTLLCPRHHRQVHRQGWTGRLDPNGNPQHIPPTWIDPQQNPRQHHRFPLRR